VTSKQSSTGAELITPIVRPPVGESALQQIATRVNQYMTKSFEHLFAAGMELIKAKERVGHGQFERLFQDHPRHVKHPVRFTSRHAQKLMSIAAHAVLGNPEHRSLLPLATRTLYALAQLPASTVQRALTSGLIHPEMEERDVVYLRSGKDERPRPRLKGARSDVAIEREIAATLRSWWQRFPHKHAFILEEVQALSGTSDPVTAPRGGGGPS
jgi:hypothetical protein